MTGTLHWGPGPLLLEFEWADDRPFRLARATVTQAGDSGAPVLDLELPPGIAAVELLTADSGHAPSTSRLVHTRLGADLRYAGHRETAGALGEQLEVTLRHEGQGVEVRLELQMPTGVAAVRSSVVVRNVGSDELVLRR